MDYLNTTRSVINHVLDNSESLGNSNVNSSDFLAGAKSAESEVVEIEQSEETTVTSYEQTEEVAVAATETVEAPVTVDQKPEVISSSSVAAAVNFDAKAFNSRIVAIISEKTGYPEDMLDLDMDLEADLGIDSIKKVEIFSELSEDLPAELKEASDDASSAEVIEELGSLKTIAEITKFIGELSTKTSIGPAETTILLPSLKTYCLRVQKSRRRQ